MLTILWAGCVLLGRVSGLAVRTLWAMCVVALGGLMMLSFWLQIMGVVGLLTGAVVGGLLEGLVNAAVPEAYHLNGQVQLAVGVLGALAITTPYAAPWVADWLGEVRARGWAGVTGKARRGLRHVARDLTLDRTVAGGLTAGMSARRPEDLRRLRHETFPSPPTEPAPVLSPPAGNLRRRGVDAEPLFSIEPFVGWRRWRVRPWQGDSGMVLTSAVLDFVWEGPELVAGCHSRLRRTRLGRADPTGVVHRSPDPDCACGIYTVKEPHQLGAVPPGLWVEGRLSMWGKVLEAQRGYRAEQARIMAPLMVVWACVGDQAATAFWRECCPRPVRWLHVGRHDFAPLCEVHSGYWGGKPPGVTLVGIDHVRVPMERELSERYGAHVYVEGGP